VVQPIPCEHGNAWECAQCAPVEPCRHGEVGPCRACDFLKRADMGTRRRRALGSVKLTGIVLCAVGLIAFLLSFAANAEEPVRDVPAGVVCTVPGVPAPVPLLTGSKLVPPLAWSKLDAELRRLQAIETSRPAREAELERQSTEHVIQALIGGTSAGIAVGFVVAWIVRSRPGS